MGLERKVTVTKSTFVLVAMLIYLYQLCPCSEKLFMTMADHVANDGFKDVGYEYINIDVSQIGVFDIPSWSADFCQPCDNLPGSFSYYLFFPT